jgi:YVTN family beta-propeller protein
MPHHGKGNAMRHLGRRTAAIVAAAAAAAAGLAALTGVAPGTGAASAQAAASASRAGGASPGANLLRNGSAQAGTVSQQGWDAVTIPGWQIAGGLPTVVRYGTAGFPPAADAGRRGSGQRLFAGGAGGTAQLTQQVPLRPAADGTLPSGTRFTISGWFGGTVTSHASLTVIFLSAAGRHLGQKTIGPVGGSGTARHPDWAFKMANGLVPAGTRSAEAEVTLRTSLRNDDGPDAPQVGYDRAVAAGLHFSVSVPARRPALTPPVSRVPGYQHVFLFYFENEDFGQVIGNTAQAPYLNRLLPRSSLLANFYAEEHPSDGNYLALAGGSTFGIPLDDPEEENPQYTINARNVADLVDGAHESWKAYLQSANGPCDDTVHENYWDDDQPMMYFADVRERPAYCAAHVVPLQELAGNLRRASTTPNFAWVSPDDCSDMEGCGIAAGDAFLRQELGAIMRSPAWTRQRSLAIITFDEDGYDFQHPAQRVATIVLGSRGVRQGYVSTVRYTHYSLLRTVEGALGLGPLTANDRYAQPVNDVFISNAPSHPGLAAPAAGPAGGAAADAVPRSARAPSAPAGAAAARAAAAGAAGAAPGPTAFVVNNDSNSVTPVSMSTRKAGAAIPVGADPDAIALTPDGKTAYVANGGSGTVTPIDAATQTAGTPIRVGADPDAIAITPDGKTAYAANAGSGTVTPIDTATGRALRPVRVGAYPRALAITPDGRTLYVVNWAGGSVTPVDTRTGAAGPAIATGSFPFAIAITPDGRTAYVVNYGSDTVTPVDTATQAAGAPIPVGQAPDSIAITPDGRTAYVADGDSDALTPIATVTGRAGAPIRTGYSPASVAIAPSGVTAYVVNTISGTVTPVSTGTGAPGGAIPVGLYEYPLAMAFAPDGNTALVLDTYAGQVTPVDPATGHPAAPITVGNYPVAAVIAP